MTGPVVPVDQGPRLAGGTGIGQAAALIAGLTVTARLLGLVRTIAVAGGWIVVIAADVLMVLLVPARWVVAMLGLGNTMGLTVAGIALVAAVRRAPGSAALRGAGRTAATGLAAAAAGALVGASGAAALPTAGPVAEGGVAVLAACCTVAVFLAIAYRLDGGDTRAALARVRRAIPR